MNLNISEMDPERVSILPYVYDVFSVFFSMNSCKNSNEGGPSAASLSPPSIQVDIR